MKLSHTLSFLACLSAISCLHGQIAPSGTPAKTGLDSKPYTIFYTGKLMGFARTPDIQTLTDLPPLPNGRDNQPNRIAAKYLKLVPPRPCVKAPDGALEPATATTADGKTVRVCIAEPNFLLGMGDNFAPDLFARTFDISQGPPVPGVPLFVRQPKDRFDYFQGSWHWQGYQAVNNVAASTENANGHAKITYDNVAQFLIQAGYRALVPGKHDFYYGPERLRSLAGLLALNGVRMLGANLVISTTRAPQADNVYPRIPERLQTHHYETGFKSVAPDLADVMLPYKRQFVVKNGLQVIDQSNGKALAESEFKRFRQKDVLYRTQLTDVQICKESGPPTEGKPAEVLDPGQSQFCMKLEPAINVCPPKDPTDFRAATCNSILEIDKISQDAVYLFANKDDRLTPGLNHLFCAKAKLDAAKWTCQPFEVQLPLFWYGEPGNTPPTEESRRPYVVLESFGVKLAVFGVVDPDLMTNVGLLNDSWNNNQSRFDTVAKVTPPDYALKQALEACNSDAECRAARKVVMAQMSYAKAAQLITQFKDVFDAVISEADSRHNTGNRTLTVTADEEGKAVPESPFLLTPPESFDPAPPFHIEPASNRRIHAQTRTGEDQSGHHAGPGKRNPFGTKTVAQRAFELRGSGVETRLAGIAKGGGGVRLPGGCAT